MIDYKVNMTENPQAEKDLKGKREKLCEDEAEESEKRDWEKDQKAHRYYYDDAHGYEVYNADDEDEEEQL